jgi:hypothetical protein
MLASSNQRDRVVDLCDGAVRELPTGQHSISRAAWQLPKFLQSIHLRSSSLRIASRFLLMRYRIKIVAGDKVLVEMTPYDLAKGRITYRFS